MNRVSRSVALVLTGSLLLVALGAPPVSSQPAGPTSGSWVGFMHYDSTAVFRTDDGDVPVRYDADGNLEFETSAGSLTGTYQLHVEAELVELGVTGISDLSGTLSGPATEPVMTFEFLTASSQASGITMELTFSSAELGNPQATLKPTDGTCSNISGTWHQEFANGMAEQGNTVDQLSGTWQAIRRSSLGDNDLDTFEDEMGALEDFGQDILDDLRSGSLDTDQLRDYLAAAEGAILAGTIRSNCDEGVDSATQVSFQTFASATLDQVLLEAAEDIDALTDEEFFALFRSGYRTGTFGSADELKDFYEAELARRTDVIIASGDAAAIQQLLAWAVQYGEHELAAELMALLEGIGA